MKLTCIRKHIVRELKTSAHLGVIKPKDKFIKDVLLNEDLIKIQNNENKLQTIHLNGVGKLATS